MRRIYVYDQTPKASRSWFAWVLVVFFLATTIYFAWISLTIQTDPIVRTYERYNHLRLYEDGSYTGEDRQGEAVNGCVVGGLCKD